MIRSTLLLALGLLVQTKRIPLSRRDLTLTEIAEVRDRLFNEPQNQIVGDEFPLKDYMNT